MTVLLLLLLLVLPLMLMLMLPLLPPLRLPCQLATAMGRQRPTTTTRPAMMYPPPHRRLGQRQTDFRRSCALEWALGPSRCAAQLPRSRACILLGVERDAACGLASMVAPAAQPRR